MNTSSWRAPQVQARHPLGPLPQAAAALPYAPARPPAGALRNPATTMPTLRGRSPAVPWGPMWPPTPVSAWLQGKPVPLSIMRPYRGPAPLPTAQTAPPGSLSAVPHAGGACLGKCGCLDAAGTLPTGRTGQGRRAWWVVSHRAQLGSWLCSDPRGTPTFGTSGSRLAKWE